MEVITIDLVKNPDVAALVADLQPSQKIYGCFTIKDKDDQTLSIRIEEMAASKDELSSEDEAEDEEMEEEEEDEMEDGEEEEVPQSPEGAEEEPPSRKLARQLEGGSSY
jgi:hypothetical protein